MIINDINYIEAVEANEVQGGALPTVPTFTALALGNGTSTAFGTALSFTDIKLKTDSVALPNYKFSGSQVAGIAGATV
ncbi:MAG: hypothetical protein IGR93_05710 [Hydrococcus sp. C42_A2020_068]|uniref:hypothetical protein n=1 Tax=Pleurocapsa sp. PCC 7327 TaxID=118163 RepID=UPI00029FA350|nr:hypothetical protein [Pleurocapsa sp. PCC 7327]AFY77390.1 hypothetical protein Ple7327_2061 [Pleurocapsa sp. PCC 7327]MBF2019600.1 hypothetical protein [Hydrococcus sp. C42_A2020_068]